MQVALFPYMKTSCRHVWTGFEFQVCLDCVMVVEGLLALAWTGFESHACTAV